MIIDPDLPGSHLGSGMGWPPREDSATGDFVRVTDEQSISECLMHLIHITPGVVPGLEAMGTEVERLLFEDELPSEAALIGDSIVRAIRTHEKRVFVLKADFSAKRLDNNLYGIIGRIRYRVRSTGEIVGGVFPFYLKVQAGP